MKKNIFLKYSSGICLSLIVNSVSATPIVDFSGGSTTFGGGDFTIGYTFSITSSQTINGLSWWDEAGDGLASDHDIGLWTAGGSLLASTTITNASTIEASTSGFGNWMVESIMDLTLGVGDYIVGGVQTNSIGGDLLRINATATSILGVVYGNTIQNTGNGTLTMPDFIVSSVNDGAWGANVHFNTTTTVPEPSTIALLALGIAGFNFSKKKNLIGTNKNLTIASS